MHKGKQVGFIQHENNNIDKVMHNGNCVFEQGYPRDNNTITGDIVLDGTIGKSLKSWSITGNTVQDGTPSPDNPVEIQSVGERTKNLFDKNTTAFNDLGVGDIGKGVFVKNSVLGTGVFSIKCGANTTYTIYSPNGNNIFVAFGDATAAVGVAYRGAIIKRDTTVATITTDDTAKYLYVYCVFGRDVDAGLTIDYVTDKLFVGTGYMSFPICLPIVSRGKNIFDYKTMSNGQSGVYLKEDGELGKYETWSITDYIPCSGTVFTINSIGGINAGMCLYDSQKNFITGIAYGTRGAEFKKPITIKSETNASYIRFSYNTDADGPSGYLRHDDLSKIQLEEGSVATAYEPYREPITTPIYLSEPLQIGETLNSDGTRDVKWDKIVLTGNEAIEAHKTFNDGSISIRINTKEPVKVDSMTYCTHLPYVTFSKLYNEMKPGTSTHNKETINMLYCLIEGFTTLSQYKDFFSNQYDAGTPVTVYYQLATPTTETIEVPQIPTFRNTPTIRGIMTSLSVDTTIKPSATNVSFRSTNKYQRYISRYIDFDNNKMSTISGDFSNIKAFTNRRRCNVLDDGTISAFYGDDNYTEDGSNGQVMVYQPKFYYKIEPIRLEPITDSIGYHIREAIYSVSDIPLTGYKLHPAFINEAGNEVDYFCLSAFEGCAYDVSNSAYITNDSQTVDFTANTGDKLSSIANVKPMSGLAQQLTRPNSEIIAKNRGTGWHTYGIKQASANQMLMFIEYGNLQSNIGSGVVSITDNSSYNCSSYTGSTSSLGNTTGRATSTINEIGGTETTYTNNGKTSISYRGMENPYGNIWEFVCGVNIHGDGTQRSGVPYICTDYNYAESKNSGNYVSAGFTTVNANGYIKAFGYGNPDYDWLFIGSDTGGKSNGIIGDYHYVSANLNGYRVALLGGYWRTGSDAGGFYWYLHSGVGGRIRNLGARLCYVPQS